jgi:hypothetical protein
VAVDRVRGLPARAAVLFEEHVASFVDYLSSRSPMEALIKAGIWSKAFWLRP